MGKETKKSSAQLEVGTPQWQAARAREAAEEARWKALEEAERKRIEEAKARAAAEAQRETLERNTAQVKDSAPVKKGRKLM